MDKKEKRSFDIIVYSMMIVAVIYAVIQTILGNNHELHYKLVLGLWILAAVTLNDFIDPMVTGKFDTIREDRIKYFMLYSIADAGAYACLYIFVINVNLFKEPMHYVFLVIGIVLFVVKSSLFTKISVKPANKTVEKDFEEDNFEVNTLGDDDDLQVYKYRHRK